MRRRLILAAPAVLLAAPARAGTQPVVVELFTSQSCSSCPPADVVLRDLVQSRPDVLALSFHVTYWDRLGWRDRFSLAEATERQRRYAGTIQRSAYGAGQVYTPQAVVQGRQDAVGSNRAAILAAIAAAASAPRVDIALRPDGGLVAVDIAPGTGTGTVWLVGYDPLHVTAVRGGENGGRTLTHVNVVRGLARAGLWQGQALRIAAAAPAGERVAVLLQAADGGILGAATL